MSRLAKYPMPIPESVDVQVLEEGFGVKIKGPLGEIQKKFPPLIKISRKENALVFERLQGTNFAKAMHGTVASIVKNMLKGVKEGFEKNLQIMGLGYQFVLKGSDLVISCGYSKEVHYPLPKEIKAVAAKNSLSLKSFDKELLGRIASEIRAIRPPEPYKGKGIRYKDEVIKKKVGKAGAAGGTGVMGK
ncbi:MAG: 50S ribosomal protein L6 [bacterium]